ADRHRHQWYSVQLASAILAEEIARSPVLLRILKRDQRIEDRHDLRADLGNRRGRNDEDEIVAADVADESLLVTAALHHVVENLRENANDAIALVVRIAIVEFL